MSLDEPVYSKNQVIAALEHLGHDLHEGESFLSKRLPQLITLEKDVQAQYPELKSELLEVVADAQQLQKLAAPIATAASNGFVNPIADGSVAVSFEQNWPSILKLYNSVVKLAKTIGADVKIDAAVV